jgi:hypothetical protein
MRIFTPTPAKQTTPSPAQFTDTTADELESLEKDLADKKAMLSTGSEKLLRLIQLNRSDSVDQTVINRERPSTKSGEFATKATIDIWDEPTANRSTGVSAAEAAKSRDDDRDSVLRGEPLADRPSVTGQIDDQNRYCRAIEAAIESITRDINRKKAILAQNHCEKLKPQYREDMRLLCKALADAHAVHVKLNTVRQHLIDTGIGFRGVYLSMPDSFLNHALNKYSEFADFMRDAKRDGFIDAIPAEYVL